MKYERSVMLGDAMPNEINDFIKVFCSTPLEKMQGFVKKSTLFDPVSVYHFAIEQGNLCLFESYVGLYLQLQNGVHLKVVLRLKHGCTYINYV